MFCFNFRAKDLCALHAVFFSAVLMPGFSINRVQSDINEVVSLFSFTAENVAAETVKQYRKLSRNIWFLDTGGTSTISVRFAFRFPLGFAFCVQFSVRVCVINRESYFRKLQVCVYAYMDYGLL